jgi:hypothetical protein
MIEMACQGSIKAVGAVLAEVEVDQHAVGALMGALEAGGVAGVMGARVEAREEEVLEERVEAALAGSYK